MDPESGVPRRSMLRSQAGPASGALDPVVAATENPSFDALSGVAWGRTRWDGPDGGDRVLTG